VILVSLQSLAWSIIKLIYVSQSLMRIAHSWSWWFIRHIGNTTM